MRTSSRLPVVLRGSDRRHRLEPAHLVVRHPEQFSSHTLIGGFAGAALAGAGFDVSSINIEKIALIAAFIFLAPLVGMLISVFITLVTIVQKLWLRVLLIALATAITSMFVLKNMDLRIALVVFSLVFIIAYAMGPDPAT
jgi:PiT family inorganic phosphate transporter